MPSKWGIKKNTKLQKATGDWNPQQFAGPGDLKTGFDRRTKGVDVYYLIAFIENIEDTSESFPSLPPDPYNLNSTTWFF